MPLWDISQPLRPDLPVWPGDTPFSARRVLTLGTDGPVNVSAFSASTHAGTHADAPLHYAANGAPADAVDLEPYVGPCLLVDARGQGATIGPDFVGASVPDGTVRVLFRTYDRFPHTAWLSDFTALASESVRRLAAKGVRLIGVDAPSIDPEVSKTMDAHHAALETGMRLLEGLVLDAPPPGTYELIALPLALVGLDAAPVRAVLRSPG